MNKQLLILFLLSFSMVGFGQNKEKKTNQQDFKKAFQLSEQQPKGFVDFSDKELKRFEKTFQKKTQFRTLDGRQHPVVDNEFMVQFNEGVSFEEMTSLVNSINGLDKIEKDRIFTPRNIAVVKIDTKGDFKTIFSAITTLNNNSKVKFAHLMYRGFGETNFGATNQVIVRLKSSADLDLLYQEAARFGGNVLEDKGHPKQNMFIVEASAQSNFDAITLSQKLLNTNKFEYAEPDVYMSNLQDNTNDPLVGDQWGLNNDGTNTATWGGTVDVDINAFEAWGVNIGTGVRIGVIDDGVDSGHQDIRVLPGFDATGAGSGGDPTGGDSHGTSCAGIAAAIGDNNEGVAGVAHGAEVVPIRFLVGGGGSLADAVTAVLWAYDEGDVDLTSNSWGGGGFSQALLDAINTGENARDGLGALFITSSGNGNGAIGFPAAMDSDLIVVVGAMSMCGERKSPTSCDDETFWGADFGDELDICGPSPKIVTTVTGGNYTTTFNGTSAACPFVAGVAALVVSNNPTLTADATRAILETTARKLGDNNYVDGVPGHPNGSWNDEVGHGLVNAFDAAVLASGDPEVIISPSSTNRTFIEAEGCAVSTDYQFDVRILGEYTGTDNPEVTVSYAGSAMDPADYEIVGSSVLTFTTGVAETQSLTVRVFSDGINDAGETIDFSLSLDAGDTDAVLGSADFTSTSWTINDATVPEDPAEVTFVNDAPIEVEVCFGVEMNLEIQLDNFPEESSWEVTNSVGAVVASGGTYGSEPDGALLSIDFTLPGADAYTFSFFDSWGDGLFAPGYARLTNNGNLVAEVSGDFDMSDSTDFCVDAGGGTFNGILQLDSTFLEIENCGDNYAEYLIAINISECVSAEQDVVATVVVLDNGMANQATEGVDFIFPVGKSVTFDGSGEASATLPIRFLADGLAEGAETLQLGLMVDNEAIVNYGDPAITNLTILDSDQPVISIESSVSEISEGDYNCDMANNMYEVTISAIGCPSPDTNVEVTVQAAATSVAVEGEDFIFVGGNMHTFTFENIGEPVTFTVEVLNDGIVEGSEMLELTAVFANPDSASLTGTSTVVLKDPMGVTPPSIGLVVDNDHEDGMVPAGWTVLQTANSPNGFTISGNTDLDGMAAHISNDVGGTDEFNYDNTSGGNGDAFMVSPLFNAQGKTVLDFLMQVQGEAGFFGAFDFGFVGIIDETVDATSTADIVANVNGFQLLGQPSPILFSDAFGEIDLSDVYANAGFTGQARLVFVWRSDFSVVQAPPLAVDNVQVKGGNYIEEAKMIGDQRPNYPIDADNDTYFYNAQDMEIAMMVNSSSDHGCSSGYIYQAGQGTQQFISEYPGEFAAEKTFAVEVPNADKDAELAVGLYYVEEEIAGWESSTGMSRDDLYMFKTYDYALGVAYDTDVTLDITLDNFPEETSWEVVDDSTGEVVRSGGTYGDQPDGGSVSVDLDIPAGDYTFTIFDAFGDGICCGFGDGSYMLTAGAETITEGGAFGDSESVSFTTSDVELDLCNDYRDIEFAPVTFIPYEGGFQLRAMFETGLAEFTGFGISAIPSFTPGEFTAVQNEEQVDITFVNKYSQDNIAYFIFEEQSRDLEWVELETVTPNSTGMYEIVDYYPYVGINRYRVTAVLNNTDKLMPCYEAEVFYESTNDFQVNPNPAVNNINILISDGNIEGVLDMGIYDERGRMVMAQDLISYSGVMRYDVDISALAVGQYYIRLESEDGHTRYATFIKTSN